MLDTKVAVCAAAPLCRRRNTKPVAQGAVAQNFVRVARWQYRSDHNEMFTPLLVPLLDIFGKKNSRHKCGFMPGVATLGSLHDTTPALTAARRISCFSLTDTTINFRDECAKGSFHLVTNTNMESSSAESCQVVHPSTRPPQTFGALFQVPRDCFLFFPSKCGSASGTGKLTHVFEVPAAPFLFTKYRVIEMVTCD